MTTSYWKATAPNGLDFYSGTIDYAAALVGGKRVRCRTKPQRSYRCCTSDVLHASDVPTGALVGGSWPCRLFEVTGRPVAQAGHKFGFRSLAVVREVDSHLVFGMQGVEVVALVERARTLTADETSSLAAAGNAAGDAAWAAARTAARAAAWDAAWDAAWAAARDAAWNATRAAARAAAWDAAWALTVRDLISTEHYTTLTHPWRTVIGPIHDDDPVLVTA